MEQKSVPAAVKKPKNERRFEFSGMSKLGVRRETISYLFLLPSLIFFVGFGGDPHDHLCGIQLSGLRPGGL